MTQSCYISALVRLMRTLHSGSSTENGNTLTSGASLVVFFTFNIRAHYFKCSGFRSSFDRGCLSLWFNFRRNVSQNIVISIIHLEAKRDHGLVLSQMRDCTLFIYWKSRICILSVGIPNTIHVQLVFQIRLCFVRKPFLSPM